jgi:hypothetical protein
MTLRSSQRETEAEEILKEAKAFQALEVSGVASTPLLELAAIGDDDARYDLMFSQVPPDEPLAPTDPWKYLCSVPVLFPNCVRCPSTTSFWMETGSKSRMYPACR